MTNEKAIEWLEWILNDAFLNSPLRWDAKEALRMAIEALKKEDNK